MRLAGVETAEVAAAATSTAKSASAKTTWPPKATTSAEEPAGHCSPGRTKISAALPTRQTALGADGLDCIADAVHVQAGHWAHLTRLPGDSHRISSKVGVTGDRGQCRPARASRAGCPGLRGLRVDVATQRAHQAQILRTVPRQLADGLRGHLRLGALFLLPFLLDSARGQQQLEIHRLVVTRGI